MIVIKHNLSPFFGGGRLELSSADQRCSNGGERQHPRRRRRAAGLSSRCGPLNESKRLAFAPGLGSVCQSPRSFGRGKGYRRPQHPGGVADLSPVADSDRPGDITAQPHAPRRGATIWPSVPGFWHPFRVPIRGRPSIPRSSIMGLRSIIPSGSGKVAKTLTDEVRTLHHG